MKRKEYFSFDVSININEDQEILYYYEIYIDDVYDTFVLSTEPTGKERLNLDSDTTYKISIRPIYDIDGTEFAAFDTDLFETTL